MALVIAPRKDLAPASSDVIEVGSIFRLPSTIEPTRRMLAIQQETHEDTVQLLAGIFKADLATRANTQLATSASQHLVKMGADITQIAVNAPAMLPDIEEIIGPAVNAIVMQVTAHVGKSTVVAAQNTSELSTKTVTGNRIIAAEEAAEAQRLEDERRREKAEAEERLERLRLERQREEKKGGFLSWLFG